MYKIAICDDDAITLQYVNQLVETYFNGECRITRYDNAQSLELYLYDIIKGNIDILLIDIDLIDYNGIEIAKKLNLYFPQIKIIFLTGHIDFSQNIFEAHPTYFLVKPITYEKLAKSLDAAVKAMEDDKYDSIAFSVKGAVISIKLKQIKFIESYKRVIYLHENDGVREIYNKLDEIEKKLPGNFIRCHQSYIVNMDRVKHLNQNHFLLYSEEKIPVSQLKYRETKSKFIEYLGETL